MDLSFFDRYPSLIDRFTMSRLATVVIKALTVIAFVLILLVQVFLIPEAAQSSAVMYPIFAYLAVPGIIGCVAVLACVQVVLVCVWRLVDLASAGRIFNGRALVWVDVIIGAIWAAVALVLIGEISLVMIGAAPPFASGRRSSPSCSAPERLWSWGSCERSSVRRRRCAANWREVV
jgi:hypothetical protein